VRIRHRGVRRLAVVVGLLGLVSALVVPVSSSVAQEGGDEAGSVLLVMDASGSMNRVGGSGRPLIDDAKVALVRLVEALPEGTAVGLRVYGHRVANDDPVNGCEDTELVVPVGPLDRGQMTDAIVGFEAKGFTPIGRSLQEAVDDLPADGRRTVVLVSDGEDTCAPPDPCEVARGIIADGVDLRVETLGFLIDAGSAAEMQLQCVAEVTGGSYRTVGEADELAGALSEVVGEAVGGPTRAPLIVDGSPVMAEAPTLELHAPTQAELEAEPGLVGHVGSGSWRGLVLPGETRWWAVELADDEQVDVSGLLFRPADLDLAVGEAFELMIINSDLETVGFDQPGFGPTRVSVVDPAVAAQVWATMSDVSDGTGIPQPPPLPGVHYIGFTWDRAAETALAEVEFMVEVLRGGNDGASAELPIDESVHYLGFIGGAVEAERAPLVDLVAYEGPLQDETTTHSTGRADFDSLIGQGETLWYAVDLDGTEDILVTVYNRSDLSGVEGELSVRIHDANGDQVGEYHPLIGPEQIDLADTGSSFTIGSTSEVGTIGPIRGRHLIELAWDAEPGPQTIDLHVEIGAVIVPGAQYPDPQPPYTDSTDSALPSDGGTEDDQAQADSANGDSNGLNPLPLIALCVGAVLTAGLIFGIWRRTRAK
jgi:hypothetical protein